MTIEILTLEEAEREYKYSKEKVIATVAKWHFSEWGKYSPQITIQQWTKNLEQSIASGTRLILAVKDNKLVGSISLKKTNMENMFPEYTCWLSGLYILPEHRKQGISAMLIQKLAQMARDGKNENIYVFSHDLALEQYYKKLGWEIIKPPNNTSHYIYKNAPIILLKATPEQVLKDTQIYLDTKKKEEKKGVSPA